MPKHEVEILIWDGCLAEAEALAAARGALEPAGLRVTAARSLPSRRGPWEAALDAFAARAGSPCLLTVGGAGWGPGEFLPDLLAARITRAIPGIPEAIRDARRDDPLAPLFRGTAGLTGRGGLMVNLPHDEGWLRECLAYLARVLGHALDKAAGDTGECGRP